MTVRGALVAAIVAGGAAGAACSHPAAEPLHAPARVPHVDPPASDEPVTIDDCATDFHRPASEAARPATPASTARGDRLVAEAEGQPDPEARAAGYVAAIADYRQALLGDPYNADVTLALALAYDRVYRKGCALQLLRRLDALAQSKPLGAAARAAVAKVGDNTQWFRTYRREAEAALGR
jgi:hypothetical protein